MNRLRSDFKAFSEAVILNTLKLLDRVDCAQIDTGLAWDSRLELFLVEG